MGIQPTRGTKKWFVIDGEEPLRENGRFGHDFGWYAGRLMHDKQWFPGAASVFIFINLVIPAWAMTDWIRMQRTGNRNRYRINVWRMAFVYFLMFLGISVGYHRHFTHRSFKASLPVRWSLALLGQLAMEGDAFYWTAQHRTHHRHCDQDLDPHSPVHGGFFHAQGGYVWTNGSYDFQYRSMLPDLWDDSSVRWLSQQSIFSLYGLPLLSYVAFGTRATLWNLHVPTVVLWHGTQLVNSATHLWGDAPYRKDGYGAPQCTSKNNPWIFPLVYSEAWHNNHHAMPWRANFGMNPGELDPAYWIILLLERLGLVWDVRRAEVPLPVSAVTPLRRALELLTVSVGAVGCLGIFDYALNLQLSKVE